MLIFSNNHQLVTGLVLIGLLFSSCGDEDLVVASGSEDDYFSKELYFSQSPDHSKSLKMGEGGDDSTGWFTQILMDFGGCGGGVYAPDGKNLGIKTYWKNNDTIVIETRKSYKALQKNTFMQCLNEKVTVIYVEN